ncbi:MAG: hypothetical protein JRN20_14180 [Nitrososphaerota archaeon]|nr:hypothetical protein [Nitrososphaerota archaeon]MDG6924040.1 hypothetical protein [Nitrososphaerota archaeon]
MRLNELLKRVGFDSVFVGHALSESDDETVLLGAEREKRILLLMTRILAN